MITELSDIRLKKHQYISGKWHEVTELPDFSKHNIIERIMSLKKIYKYSKPWHMVGGM